MGDGGANNNLLGRDIIASQLMPTSCSLLSKVHRAVGGVDGGNHLHSIDGARLLSDGLRVIIRVWKWHRCCMPEISCLHDKGNATTPDAQQPVQPTREPDSNLASPLLETNSAPPFLALTTSSPPDT